MCVFGINLNLWIMIPDDGLCDYIFYTEVYMRESELMAYYSPTSFSVFVESANNYNRSLFGFSFHPE